MSALRNVRGTLVLLLGLVLLFVGERLVGAGTWRAALSGAGGLCVLLAGLERLLRRTRAPEDRRSIEGRLLLLDGAVVLALLLYVAQSDLWARLFGQSLANGCPRLAGALSALWPAVLLGAVLPLVLAELAYAAVARAPQVERGRIWDALLSGVGMAAVLVFAFAAVYVATARDAKWDLSYFRTAKPGDSTLKLVQGLKDPVDVTLFFPPANEVHDQVADYFALLAQRSPQLRIHEQDRAVDPAKARELGVTGNGAVVLAHGTQREQLYVGTDKDRARTDLSRLDQEVNRRLLRITRARRHVYFVTGHGERSNEAGLDTDHRSKIYQLQELFTAQNAIVSRLGAGEGLGREVPANASLVALVGPQQPLLPEEAASLLRYVHQGGRLLIAVDPEAGADFSALLKPLGIDVGKGTLANDEVFVRSSYQISDRANIATASFASHAAVASLSQLGSRAPVLLIGASPLEPRMDRAKDVSVDFTVFAQPRTFNDQDGDFSFTPKLEERKAFPLVAAVTVQDPKDKKAPQGRAVVIGDSDVLTDAVLQNPGNLYLAADSARWLLGDDAISGTITTETDAPIQHTRAQDVAWFYSTLFAAPALVLAAGFGVTRRKRRSR